MAYSTVIGGNQGISRIGSDVRVSERGREKKYPIWGSAGGYSILNLIIIYVRRGEREWLGSHWKPLAFIGPRQEVYRVQATTRRPGIARALRGLARCLAAERDRWVLWVPVGLGLGIGAYFAVSTEPPLWLGFATVVGVVVLGAIANARIDHGRIYVVASAMFAGMIAVGFTAAQVRTAIVAAPMLAKKVGPVSVLGHVTGVDVLANGSRLILDRPRITRLDPNRTPERVRVRLRGSQPTVRPGDWVRLFAVLTPPPPPAIPGAFDFQRQSFFAGLGAVGYAIGPAEIVTETPALGLRAFKLWISRLRGDIATRVYKHVDGATAAVIVALMTGDRGAIPVPVIQAIRDSGIAHLLAISGLHIGLVAGFLFVSFRCVLALIPPLALRFPVKKLAVIASIFGAGSYMMLAGATIPSQRAFLMIAIVLIAVLVDRRGISMRLVAWAAIVILIFRPESLLGASFQLSFAAVVALVAVYEAMRGVRGANRQPLTWRKRMLLYVGGVALTTLVAGAATAPFVVYHFNRFSDYWLVTNMVAVPATALWIMPWAVVAFLLMPFGLEGLALAPIAWGVDVVIWIATTVSTWPGAVSLLPPMPVWGLILVAAGGTWLCLWHERWRLWGLAAISVGALTTFAVDPPDVLVDGRGKLLAVKSDDGKLTVSSLRAAPFSRNVWLRRIGQDEKTLPWPRYGPSPDGRLNCDLLGCIYHADDVIVALVRRPEALLEDCQIADVIVSTVPVGGGCPTPHTIIDRFDLWRNGTHALWLEDGRVRVESVNGMRGERPWVLPPA